MSQPSLSTRKREACRILEAPARSVDESFIARWKDLCGRSLEDNVFLSPQFVIPALRHLPNEQHKQTQVVAVESVEEGRLLLLALVDITAGSRLLPLRHLRCWRSEYSMFDGLLVDRDCSEMALGQFFRWLRKERGGCHGISFRDRSATGPLAEALAIAASRSGVSWLTGHTRDRAAIPVQNLPESEDELLAGYSRSRRKTLRRNRKKLETGGPVEYRLSPPEGDVSSDPRLENFLRLESMGRNGSLGTAMASTPEHEKFCREMASGLASGGQVMFGELSVGGTVVASTMNLLAGSTLFAFKIGWHVDFAEGSPGTLSELELLKLCRSRQVGWNLVDSCASSGSYVEHIWPGRRPMISGSFLTTPMGKLAARAMIQIRRIKRLLRRSEN